MPPPPRTFPHGWLSFLHSVGLEFEDQRVGGSVAQVEISQGSPPTESRGDGEGVGV